MVRLGRIVANRTASSPISDKPFFQLRTLIRNDITIVQSESMQRKEKFVIRLVRHILKEQTLLFLLLVDFETLLARTKKTSALALLRFFLNIWFSY
jgi:hypothetical protein